ADIEGFHPNLRRGLKKALREFHSSDGWKWMIHAPHSPEDMEILKKLCKDRFGSNCFFQISRNTVFFDEMAKRMEDETFCSVLSKEGNVASIVMGFIHRDVFYYFLSGMSQGFEEMRPGLLNLYFLIEHCKNRGCNAFDFLKGEERYKTEFNASREELDQYLIHTAHVGIGFKLYSLIHTIKNMH
ncbi:MAG: GNAT family N-acetyltransferase, partial [Chlorobi bacterium]|nr:GNAT family N-acetyltransferase [Chlorobiota bacterium]